MKHCNDRQLLQILDETLEANLNDTVSHLDECSRCQSRLVQLAADKTSWSTAQAALRDSDVYRRNEDGTGDLTASLSHCYSEGSVIFAIDSELATDLPVQADRISLDFLDPPSHPEMLGRVGRYDVERLIGAGGMGIVFKAFDSELHRPVAVKVLAPHLAHSGGARQRFAREAQSAAAVVHENVVPIHYVDTHGDLPFLVMQYVGGESLQARVERDGSLSSDEILQIGIQMARGLAAAHNQGLVHRDVKPGNILLEPAINRVLISDFGLARAADDVSVTRSGMIAGTPHYMSPEQAKGQPVDARSDLFGLGGVLYFMATSRPPFRADGAIAVLNKICSTEHRPVDDVNESITADLADLIDELLTKDPKSRPANAESVASRLTDQLKSFRSGRTRSRKRRRNMKCRLLALSTAAATLFVATVSWSWFSIGAAAPGPAPVTDAPSTHPQQTQSPTNISTAQSVESATPPVMSDGPIDTPTATSPIAPVRSALPALTADNFETSLHDLRTEIEQYELRWDSIFDVRTPPDQAPAIPESEAGTPRSIP